MSAFVGRVGVRMFSNDQRHIMSILEGYHENIGGYHVSNKGSSLTKDINFKY